MNGVMPLTPPKNLPIPERLVLVPDEKATRATIVKTWKAPGAESGEKEKITFEILRGLMNEQQFKTLRGDNAIVYSTHDNHARYKNFGEYNMQIEVDFDKIPTAMKALDEMNSLELLKQNIKQENIEMIKKQYLFAIRGGQEFPELWTEMQMDAIRSPIGPITPEIIEEKIKSITAEDVLNMAKTYFQKENEVSLTGISAPKNVLQKYYPEKVQ